MQMHRRTVLGGMAASAIATPSLVRAAEPLAIGLVPANAIHWVQLVATDLGFYKEEGFDPSIQTIQSSPQSIQFAITGQYQIATAQPEVIVAAVEQGRLAFANIKKTCTYSLSHAMPELLPIFYDLAFGL